MFLNFVKVTPANLATQVMLMIRVFIVIIMGLMSFGVFHVVVSAITRVFSWMISIFVGTLIFLSAKS